jgi:hypothetical protein
MSHVRQRGNRFGYVPVGWLLEIEKHRQVVPFAEFISDCIEHGLTLCRKAAKNEDYLGSDCVDDAADFLILQEQVDELGGDFNIIRRDDRIVIGCDN